MRSRGPTRSAPWCSSGPCRTAVQTPSRPYANAGLGKHIRLLGYVPDEDLPALYAGAGCFVFPTLYEGFGMPILEAMASGIPVLTSTTGAAPEVSGGLAVSVNPYDVEAIADGIDRALETPAPLLAQARAHARAFTWERCASQTLAIYRSIV